MVARVLTYSLNRFLASTVTRKRTLHCAGFRIAAGSAESPVCLHHVGREPDTSRTRRVLGVANAIVAADIQPTSRFRVGQEPLEMLH